MALYTVYLQTGTAFTVHTALYEGVTKESIHTDKITVVPTAAHVTDSQLLKVPLPLCVQTATLTEYSCPTSRPVMSNGEEEVVLECVAGVELRLPY